MVSTEGVASNDTVVARVDRIDRKRLNLATRSMIWLFGQNTASRFIQSGTQVVLAWLLSPTDFGRISIALTVSSLVNALFQLGLDDVILQRTKTMRLWYATVFWMSLVVATLSAATLLCSAPVVARIYGDPDLIWLIACLAVSGPLNALSTVPNAVIRARLDFRLQTILVFGEIVVTSALSIALALAHFGVYSFVLPVPFVVAARSLASWYLAGPPLSPKRRHRWRVLVPSASAVLMCRLLTTLVGWGDYMIFGLTATTNQVGLYFFAFRIAGQPMRLLAGSVTNVLFPTLVHLKPVQQEKAAMMASRVLAIVVMPVCFLQAALAGPFLRLFFGARWQSSEIFIQLLSVGLAFDAVSWIVGALLPARGEFQKALHYIAATTACFFVFVVAGALVSRDYGVPFGVAAYYMIVQPAYCFFVLRRVAKVSFWSFTQIYAAPVVLSAGTVFGAARLIGGVESDVLKLFLLPVIVLIIYTVAIWRVSPGPCRHVVERLKALRGRD